MDSRIYIFQMVFIVVTYYITNIASQTKSETKCAEYSAIPNNSVNSFTHLAIWARHEDTLNIERLIESLQGEYAILISDSYLLSATDFKTEGNGKVYFTTAVSHDVTEIIKNPVKSALSTSETNSMVLLKIRQIRIDFNYRPACLAAHNFNKPHSVQILLPILPVSCQLFSCPEFNKVLNKCLNFEMQTLELSDNDCFPSTGISNYSALFCLEKHQYGTSLSGFVQVYDFNNYYVYGMANGELDNTTNYMLAEYFTRTIIDWIESEVWEVTSVQTSKAASCGIVEIVKDPVPLILNSRESFHGEFPWHAAIYYLTKSGGRDYQCGGSLITNNMVITAAHCVLSSAGTKLAQEILVILGKHDFILTSPESRETRVINIVVHTDYNYNTHENDIALLQLEIMMQLSEHIQTICLTNNPLLFGDQIGVLPGWGLNEFNFSPAVLVQASFPIRPKSACRGNMTYVSVFSTMVNENNLCMGYQNGTGLCMGDSGGGLVYHINDKWFLRGIASLGDSLVKTEQRICDSLALNLFTDVTKFYKWIMDRI